MITGATGQLGTAVVNLLLNKTEAKNISVLVRDPAKAESFKLKGVSIYQGDYYDYNSLVKAFNGHDKLFFISTNDMVNRESQQENVVKAASEAKIKHIIYTSFQHKNETGSSPIGMIANVHIFTEKLIKDSGMTYTILRNGLYADFIPVIIGKNVFETGTIYLPAGNGRTAFTLRSDLAAGSVAVMTSKGHENKTYEFCSDQLYTFSEIASMLSQINGKQITYISPSNEEYKATLTKAGVPAPYVAMFAACSEGVKQGEFDFKDHTLSNLLGGKCIDLKQYLNEAYK